MATSEASQRATYDQNPGRDPKGPTRRTAIGQLLAGWGLFSMGAGVGLLGCVRFLFPNVLYEPPATFKAGPPANYGVGVDETFKNAHSTWLVRTTSDPLSGRDGVPGIFALSTTCTHLGCIPNWLAADNKFKCPCHGSGFRSSGMNFEGPAPRPLERWRVVLEDGELLVDKNQKYQWEKGQWVNAESYVAI
jgi:cytochrome b6-f complex iron-sulfur subunit